MLKIQLMFENKLERPHEHHAHDAGDQRRRSKRKQREAVAVLSGEDGKFFQFVWRRHGWYQ